MDNLLLFFVDFVSRYFVVSEENRLDYLSMSIMINACLIDRICYIAHTKNNMIFIYIAFFDKFVNLQSKTKSLFLWHKSICLMLDMFICLSMIVA